MFPRATKNAVAGHMWPADRYVATPVLEGTSLTLRLP